MTPRLKFGISSLDELFGSAEQTAAETPGPADHWTLCIIGPDGTGKSIMAMHAASQYAARSTGQPKLIYASTDLKFSSAQATWNQFGLHCPGRRAIALPKFAMGPELDLSLDIQLQEYSPTGIGEYLLKPGPTGNVREVAFLDLASNTAGDDWGFVTRLLASIPSPETDNCKHLLVIDAVQGLEFSGQHDSFGEARSKRSRIAQVIRAAHNKACLAFIVEQSRPKPVPEEFAADFVLRLRTPKIRDYRRRTLEIVKARTINHGRGEHVYVIRDGQGSSTGTAENVDDPWVQHPDKDSKFVQAVERRSPSGKTESAKAMAYIHVCPSTHRRYRVVMKSVEPSSQNKFPAERVGFGVPYLDDMLGRGRDGPKTQATAGWPAGRVSALIGDRGTAKHRLGMAFLSQAFLEPGGTLLPCNKMGVAVLISNRADDSTDQICKKLSQFHAKTDEQDAFAEAIRPYVLCRRLEIHDVAPSVLAHIVESTVQEAKNLLGKAAQGTPAPPTSDAAPEYWRIRLILADWTILRAMYPDVDADDQLLPYLIFRLNQDRVTSLFVSTQFARPNALLSDADRRFRELHDRQLLTWHVPFFGSQRTAITHLGRQQHDLAVRELRIEAGKPVVDPHFELYTDFEDHPRPVPLRLDMYARHPNQERYLAGVDRFLRTAFTPIVPSSSSPPSIIAEVGRIVHVFRPDEYRVQQALPFLKHDTRLDHTRVTMLDEFWEPVPGRTEENKEKPGASRRLVDLSDYLTRPLERLRRTTGPTDEHIYPFDDPFRIFRKYKSRGDAFAKYWQEAGADCSAIDRVPFSKSYGFLLLDESVWKPGDSVVSRLTDPNESISWSEFFDECSRRKTTNGKPSFSYGSSLEDLSCLVLEVWLSCETLPNEYSIACSRSHGQLDLFGESVKKPAFADALTSTLKLLVGVGIDPNHSSNTRLAKPEDLDFTAGRTWYALACELIGSEKQDNESADTVRNTEKKWLVCGLPGRMTTRGDWFLGIIQGSRSIRLGQRCLDILSSWRSQDARLRGGVGLPIWEFADKVPTRLCPEGPGKALNYGDVRKLGGTDRRSFLWRSRIKHYALFRSTWHRFLVDYFRLANGKPLADGPAKNWLEQLSASFDELAKAHEPD